MIEQLPQLLSAVNGLFAKIKTKIDTKLDKTGEAATARKLSQAFKLLVSGDATGTATTDGLADLAIAITLKSIPGLPAGATVGDANTVATLVVDAQGRVVSIQGIAITTGTTAAKGLVQLSSATNSTSEALAATPAAVKAAFDLANAAVPKTLDATHGVYKDYDMIAEPGLTVAKALPGALYGLGYAQGRARGQDIGMTGPQATGGRSGLLRIYAAIPSGATGNTPFNAIRREYDGWNGMKFVQYAVDANTWSTWEQVALMSGTIKAAQGLNLGTAVNVVGTPADFITANGLSSQLAAQVFVRAATDSALTTQLIVANIAALDPNYSTAGKDTGILNVWTDAIGTNGAPASTKVYRELNINGRTLVSSAFQADTTWGAWALKVLPIEQGGTAGKTMANRNIFISTADPSGGADGDIWLKYTP